MLRAPRSDKELGPNRVFSISSNWFNPLSLRGSQLLLTDREDLLHSSGSRPCSAFLQQLFFASVTQFPAVMHFLGGGTEPRVGDVIWPQNKLVTTPGIEHHHPVPIT